MAADVAPVLKVLPADRGIEMRRPGHCQRVHPVAVFQNMGGKCAVLAATAGHHYVITTIIAAEFF